MKTLILALWFCPGALASRVKRKDTLALKLSNRPTIQSRDRFTQERSCRDDQPPGQTGLTWQSREQWEAIRTQIGTALTRLAPSPSDDSAAKIESYYRVLLIFALRITLSLMDKFRHQAPPVFYNPH